MASLQENKVKSSPLPSDAAGLLAHLVITVQTVRRDCELLGVNGVGPSLDKVEARLREAFENAAKEP